MAQEITVSATLQYKKGNISTKSLSIGSTNFDITGTNFKQASQTIPTTAGGTALDVSGLANVGWLLVKNNDATNFVSLMSATSGTKFAKLKPGEIALLRLDTGITAPAALADTASVQIEYLALEI